MPLGGRSLKGGNYQFFPTVSFFSFSHCYPLVFCGGKRLPCLRVFFPTTLYIYQASPSLWSNEKEVLSLKIHGTGVLSSFVGCECD